MKFEWSFYNQDVFLEQYWQQQPLVIPQALVDLTDIIDGDELAGLACESLVESRIIAGFGLNNRWTCRQGLFNEADFSQLPETNWTLLVQGVDQWIEEVSDILKLFEFLPKWRLEDIMVSYAPTGGGVGPHFDYYDVFLVQVSGVREWKLGQACHQASLLQNNDQVKLLAEFDEQVCHQLQPGDMIYIPAGIAHWGTALSDDCITLSVGFRAPSEKELLAAAFDDIIEQLSEHKRYRDPLQSTDYHPLKLDQKVTAQLESLTQWLTPERLQASVTKAFGQLVTEPRYDCMEDSGEEYSIESIQALWNEQGRLALYHPPHSRFAYADKQLFVNGEVFTSSETFAQGVCDGLIENQPSESEIKILIHLLDSNDVILSELLD